MTRRAGFFDPRWMHVWIGGSNMPQDRVEAVVRGAVHRDPILIIVRRLDRAQRALLAPARGVVALGRVDEELGALGQRPRRRGLGRAGRTAPPVQALLVGVFEGLLGVRLGAIAVDGADLLGLLDELTNRLPPTESHPKPTRTTYEPGRTAQRLRTAPLARRPYVLCS